MIYITDKITIHEDEIQESFIRSSGPGGQNINKVSTSVQLRFNVANSQSLPIDARNRLARLAGKRMTSDGILILNASKYRSQGKNRQDAKDRLKSLIKKALEKTKPRRKTTPTRASIEVRLRTKQKTGQKKIFRKPVTFNDD